MKEKAFSDDHQRTDFLEASQNQLNFTIPLTQYAMIYWAEWIIHEGGSLEDLPYDLDILRWFVTV